MPPARVLIVEDEPGAAGLIAALCSEVGLQAQSTGSGSEALQFAERAASDGQSFACAVLDLALAELDGFQVARGLRAAQRAGQELPLIFVSGVYRQLPEEFAAEVRPFQFLPKPFDPAQLRDALARACWVGRAAPGAATGDLAQRPLARIYLELLRKRATGALTLTRETTVRRIAFEQGQIRFAQSNVRAETVGAAQVTAGLIKQASFDRAVALARQQQTPLHEALVAARVLTPEQLKAALRQQTLDVSAGALTQADGQFRFEAQTAAQITTQPDARMSPLSVLFESARRLEPAAARALLTPLTREPVRRSAELEREIYALRSAWPGESVTALATSGRSVGDVLARIKETEVPLLAVLCQSGLLAVGAPSTAQPGTLPPTTPSPGSVSSVGRASAVTLGPVTSPNLTPPPFLRSAAPAPDAGRKFTPAEDSARRMLLGERDHLEGASHYELLGVDAKATFEQIKDAYFQAAKRFHSDAFSGLDLGSAQPVAEELFARVNEAYSKLSTPATRADYDVFLSRKAQGLPTDVNEILRAESIFQRGEVLFRATRWDEAAALFREAIALNHAEAEFHAYLGMAIFRAHAHAALALGHIARSLELDPRVHVGALFAAQIHEAEGDVPAAISVLRRSLDADPDFAEAKSSLARLRREQASASKGGLLSRFLKK